MCGDSVIVPMKVNVLWCGYGIGGKWMPNS
jgi:hypothetical protein